MLTCHPFKFQAQCHLLWPRTIIEDTLQNIKQFEYIIYYIAMYLFPFLKRNTLIWYDTMYVK